MPIDIVPSGRAAACAVNASSIITFSQAVLERVRWAVGQKITVSYLSAGALLTVLFGLSEAGSGKELFYFEIPLERASRPSQ